MAYTNSKLISYTKISPNRNSPRNHEIDRVSVHCYVGQVTVEDGAAWLTTTKAQASCNYFIGTDGRIGLFVPESDRSWCTSSSANDNRAVTIECASDKTDPYAVNDKVYAALIDLLTDICRRNKKKKLLWFVDKEETLAYEPAEDEMVMTVHRWFANKACPGEYLYSKHGQIAKEVNERLEGTEPTKQAATDRIWLGWTVRESGSKGPRCVNGDKGRAQGKYQFDYRYALVPFMEYCIAYNPGHYAGFKQYIKLGAGNAKLVYNTGFVTLWQGFCDDYPVEFERLQDTYAYRVYYLEAKRYIRNLFGIDMDNHSPAVKGTLFSMAIRSGQLVAAQKFGGCTDATSDADMLGVAYSTYGSQDAGRWTKAGQWGDAVKALQAGTYTEVAMDMTSGGETLSYVVQAGSFTEFGNADRRAKQIVAAGFETIVKQEDHQYKVQCGVFEDRANADALVAALKAAGFEAVVKA